jgi:CubicO group peptidase (beta-lactamase class C family)
MRRIGLVLLVFLACAPTLEAQSVADHPRVREATGLIEVWLDAQRAYEGIPGISAAVVHDQEVIWTGATGYADPESGTPATAGTAYSICSISKLFTAIGVMQLRDAGELRLDDQVSDLLPWFDIRDTYEDSPPVTVQGLLTHSSGLPRESEHSYWIEPFDFPTRDEIVQRLDAQEMLYPSDRYYQYSNLGLTLAGEIVAEVSGAPFSEYMRSHILDPLGMRSTWPDIGEYPFPDRLAVGYGSSRRDGSRSRMPPFAAEGIAPAAGFASTVEDMARFAAWQFDAMESGGDEVLGGNTLREMQRVHWMDPDWKTTRGLGFGVYRNRGVTYVGHSGLCPGFESTIQLYPPDRLAAVVMTNAIGLSPSALAIEMLRLIKPAVVQAIKEQDEARDGATEDGRPTAEFPPEFRRFVGSYDEDPWGGESAVVPWKDGLAILWLPTMNPLDDLTRLEHVAGNTFRRIRDDGEPGETYVFIEAGNGRVTGLRYHNNTYPRMD